MWGLVNSAPALFAVLLRAVGLGPTLMPLLGEPARAAIKGLAITARRKRPAHVGAFLAGVSHFYMPRSVGEKSS